MTLKGTKLLSHLRDTNPKPPSSDRSFLMKYRTHRHTVNQRRTFYQFGSKSHFYPLIPEWTQLGEDQAKKIRLPRTLRDGLIPCFGSGNYNYLVTNKGALPGSRAMHVQTS